MQQPDGLILSVLASSEKIRPPAENPQMRSSTDRGERRSRRSDRFGSPSLWSGQASAGRFGFG
jgi:hypothetical protein